MRSLSGLRSGSHHSEGTDQVVDGYADEHDEPGPVGQLVHRRADRRPELDRYQDEPRCDRGRDHRPAERRVPADLRVGDGDDHQHRQDGRRDQDADRLDALERGRVVKEDGHDDGEGALGGRDAEEILPFVGAEREIDQPCDRRQ